MKKSILFAIPFVFSAVACQESYVDMNAGGTREITVKVGAGSVKSNWEDGTGFVWSDTDLNKFGLLTDNASSVSTAITIDPDKTASVTGTVSTSDSHLLLYYPYTDWLDAPVVSGGDASVKFFIGADQGQYSAGHHYWLTDKMVLVGNSVLSTSGSDFSTGMTMLNSILRFLVYSSSGKSENLSSVSIAAVTATRPINGTATATIDVTDGVASLGAAGGSSTSSVTLENDFSLSGITSAADTKGIYMSVFPSELENITITVTTDSYVYTFEKPALSMDLKAGKIYNLTIDLDNATKVAPAGAATETLWTGSVLLGTGEWDENMTGLAWKSAFDWSKCSAGDIVDIYYTDCGNWWNKMKLVQGKDWSVVFADTFGVPLATAGGAAYEWILTDEDIAALSEVCDGYGNLAGFVVQGTNLTITKVTYTPKAALSVVKQWDSDNVIGNWSPTLSVSDYDWSSVYEGAVVTVYYGRDTDNATYWNVKVADSAYTALTYGEVSTAGTSQFSFELTSDDVTALKSDGTIRVQGYYITPTKMTVHN